MMSKKTNHFEKIIAQLRELREKYPLLPMTTHIAIATVDYGNIEGMSEKEFSFALEKYQLELEINNFTPDKDLERIIEEGKNIDKIKLYDDEDSWEDDL